MSILKYFKRIDKVESSNALPDPEGPLSTTVPSEAIATTNEKVRDILDKSCDGKRLQRGLALSNTDISPKAINWPESSRIQNNSRPEIFCQEILRTFL